MAHIHAAEQMWEQSSLILLSETHSGLVGQATVFTLRVSFLLGFVAGGKIMLRWFVKREFCPGFFYLLSKDTDAGVRHGEALEIYPGR